MAEFLDDVGRQLQPYASLNVAPTLGARNFGGFGLRRILVFGAALPAIGAISFVLLSPTTLPLVAGLGSLNMGFGTGFPSIAATCSSRIVAGGRNVVLPQPQIFLPAISVALLEPRCWARCSTPALHETIRES